MTGRAEILVLPDRAALAAAAAEEFVARAAASTRDHGRFLVCLSGGSTPEAMYRRLAVSPCRERVRWSHVHVYFGDERCVGPEHPDSNYGLARRTLLEAVAGDGPRVFRMEGEREAQEAADRYDRLLAKYVGPTRRFDLVFLGLGDDGHTASLFPGTAALRETGRRCVANFIPQKESWRLTLTYPLINAAACVIFLVAGSDKAAVLAAVLAPSADPTPLPARGVQPTDGRLIFLVDREAAAGLPDTV